MARRITTTDLLDAIRASLPPRGRPAGEGWYTAEELAAQLGVKRTALRSHLARRIEAGAVELTVGTVTDGSGITRRANYYRLKA